MATANDIDTKAAVGKFLQRQILTPQTDDESDQGEEIQALLETIATSFLLFPQAALPLIFRGKNILRQVVQADIDTIDFIINAIGDIRNPDVDIEDVSDLIEAQTALVELDRLGRVSEDLQAFGRYQSAVDRFLDQQLGPSLKRNAKREFERSGSEARQDIFDILPSFGVTHRVMADTLADLQNSVSDFNSVDLTGIVSTRTISRVRSSLRFLQSRVEAARISNTVTAIELLSGAASLQSVATNVGIYDATVDTGVFPLNRTIELSPEDVQTEVVSSIGPWTVTDPGPWNFDVTLNESAVSPIAIAHSLEIPAESASDRVYVYSRPSSAAATYDIPTGGTLYLQITGSGVGTPFQEIALTTTGPTVPFATIVSEIDAALVDATCVEFNPGTNQFLIYADLGSTTSVVVRQDSAADAGTYTDPITSPSVSEVLGFGFSQDSRPKGEFTAESLRDALSSRLTGATLSVVGDALSITSDLDDVLRNSITFDSTTADAVQDDFGFTEGLTETQPSYLELVEDGQAVDPSSVNVFVGGIVTVSEAALVGSSLRTLNNEPITAIEGTQISFGVSLPRSLLMSTEITAPIVVATQQLIQVLSPFVGSFDGDFVDLQQVLSPIVSNPTIAQVNDALRVLNSIRNTLTNTDSTGVLDLLDSITVNPSRSQFNEVATKILRALEERGLDRALELIEAGKFIEFFVLSKNDASRSTRFLSSMEQIMLNDVPTSVIEQDIPDDQRPSGTNPDSELLSGKESSGEDEDLLAFDEDDDL